MREVSPNLNLESLIKNKFTMKDGELFAVDNSDFDSSESDSSESDSSPSDDCGSDLKICDHNIHHDNFRMNYTFKSKLKRKGLETSVDKFLAAV